ncbi:RHS repeat-associated core domain-containing protein [Candidatus Peregrinibacteria bacterium]|nr:RHS repeat-associated core domain-containing protein [Candidatus Peregrinibacteria bacterium]
MSFPKLRRVAYSLLIAVIIGSSFSYAAPGDETVYYLLEDHLGNIDVVLDEEGNVVERRDYLPYGEERVEASEEGAPDTDYGFTGKEKDDETGLYYYGARYYDSTTGRFITSDPLLQRIDQMSPEEQNQFLSDPQALNAYAYARNNPVRYVDPDGESSVEWAWWQAGSVYLMMQGNYTASYFLNHSINNTPFFGDFRSSQAPLSFSDSSSDRMSQRITGQIRDTNAYQANINHIKDKIANGDLTGIGGGEFTKNDNADLFYAIKRYDYSYEATQNEDGTYAVDITIEDTYNFKRENYDGFDNTINNIADLSEDTKALLPFQTTIEMHETITIDNDDEN